MREELTQAILREYEFMRARHLREQDERRMAAFRLNPQLQQLDAKRLSLMFEKGAESFEPEHIRAVQAELQQISRQTEELLAALSLPPDHLELHYACERCHDTGFVAGGRCACLTRQLVDAAYFDRTSPRARFENFDAQIFPDEVPQGGTITQRAYMLRLLDIAKLYVGEYPENPKPDIFMTGSVGTGKTFLLDCISNAFKDRGVTLLRLGAFEMFELIREYHAGKAEGVMDDLRRIPVLLIDDLGSEPLYNNISVEYLQELLDYRVSARLHTVISANLSAEQLTARLGERICSRLMDALHVQRFNLRGKDVRRR